MDAKQFIEILGADFYTGVPDSQLRALCDCLIDKYGIDLRHHVIAANEGNAVGLAAGYYLSTGKVPVVYMQNSGQGNALNPIASLLNENVYGIPAVFVIGWRGEPGVHDEPQHAFQGEITLRLLEDLSIDAFVISAETAHDEIASVMTAFQKALKNGRSVAFVAEKGALTYEHKIEYANPWGLRREKAIDHVLSAAGHDSIVSTTGKASRELFELREIRKEGHASDFLVVGSMGHASSIALEIAAQKPEKRIWCIDGDGAVLMHMGSLALIGASGLKNLIHIILDNSAHETVGGMPTVADRIDFVAVARACGYAYACCAEDEIGLDTALSKAKSEQGPSMVVVKCAIGSRSDLGRPTVTPQEAKRDFMGSLAIS